MYAVRCTSRSVHRKPRRIRSLTSTNSDPRRVPDLSSRKYGMPSVGSIDALMQCRRRGGESRWGASVGHGRRGKCRICRSSERWLSDTQANCTTLRVEDHRSPLHDDIPASGGKRLPWTPTTKQIHCSDGNLAPACVLQTALEAHIRISGFWPRKDDELCGQKAVRGLYPRRGVQWAAR